MECAFGLDKELPGMLESIDEVLLADVLREQGLSVERQKPIPICFRRKQFDEGFRADWVVGNLVLIELKFVEEIGTRPSQAVAEIPPSDEPKEPFQK